jgi:hypothetical protein
LNAPVHTENHCFRVAIQELNIETDMKMPITRIDAVQISQQAVIAYKDAITREENRVTAQPHANAWALFK